MASSICAKNKKCVIYDCREIYFDLAAHNHRPLRKVFSFYYESFLLKFADKIIVTALSDLHFLQKKHYKHKHLIWNVVHNFPAFLKQQPLKISAPKINLYTPANIHGIEPHRNPLITDLNKLFDINPIIEEVTTTNQLGR